MNSLINQRSLVRDAYPIGYFTEQAICRNFEIGGQTAADEKRVVREIEIKFELDFLGRTNASCKGFKS